MLDVQPVTLIGRVVELRPLSTDHAADLAAFARQSPQMFRYMFPPKAFDDETYATFIAQANANPTRRNFAIWHRDAAQAVGMTAYMDIRAEHRGLEIGSTWIAKPYQGTAVNPEIKFLMLRHAIEKLGAIRVQIKTDSRNIHSQRAIEKLGAVKEGVLRNHFIMQDGYQRDTVMYSITPDDWDGVKTGLIERLGYEL